MLEIKDLSLSLDGFSLRDISFSVAKGEYFVLLGESGAGKSLLLEAIAGLNTPEAGTILLNGTDITRTRIQQRNIGMVFQDHAVFPHLSVKQNIYYPLKNKHFTKTEKEEKVTDIAQILQISHLLRRSPSTLSGGELQRVALARALVQQPAVLLLDEPLASIDTKLSSEVRALLRQINRMGQTIIHVTHNFNEAVSLANRISIIDNGKIVQTGTPEDVFSSPINEFIAHFAGIQNFFKVKTVSKSNQAIILPDKKVTLCIIGETQSNSGYILIRNEDIILSSANFESSALNNFEGKVVDLYPSGGGMETLVDIGVILHVQISKESALKMALAAGKTVWVHLKASAIRFIAD